MPSKSKTRKSKTDKTCRYPESRDLVMEAFNHKRTVEGKKGNTIRIADILEELETNAASWWNYTHGIRVPQKDIASKMADYFYGEGTPRAVRFVSAMGKLLTSVVLPSRRTDVPERLNTGALRLCRFKLPPFSGEKDCFLDSMLNRLFEFGDLVTEDYDDDHSNNTDHTDIANILRDNDADLGSGFFATVRRSSLVKFFSLSLRVGLGAVIRKQDERYKDAVKEALLGHTGTRPQLRVIVVSDDIGEIHMKALKLSDAPLKYAHSLKLEHLKKALEEVEQGLPPGDVAIPVIVVNEYSSFQILLETNGVPVMPLSSRKEARGDRRELPSYFLSLGCSRQQPEFCEIIEQLLVLFLGTEVESTSFALAALQEKLIDQLMGKREFDERLKDKELRGNVMSFYDREQEEPSHAGRFQSAYNWTLYALGLDQYSINNLPNSVIPWGPILKRTREQIMKKLADKNEIIQAQIALIAGHGEDAISKDQLRDLCDSLDLQMTLNAVQEQYVCEDRLILCRAVQNALKGLPVCLPIEYHSSGEKKLGGEIKVHTPKPKVDTDVWRAADGFLAALEKFYSANVSKQDLAVLLGNEDSPDGPVNKIGVFRTEFRKRQEPEAQRSDGNNDERIILASIGKKSSPFYIGGAFLKKHQRSDFDQHYPGPRLELLYLWTHSLYRHLSVGTSIIREACIVGQRDGYTYLVLEVFQTLNDQVTYFLKRGFELANATKDGRLIFLLQLNKASL